MVFRTLEELTAEIRKNIKSPDQMSSAAHAHAANTKTELTALLEVLVPTRDAMLLLLRATDPDTYRQYLTNQTIVQTELEALQHLQETGE